MSNKRRASVATVGEAAQLQEKSLKKEKKEKKEKKAKTTEDIETSVEATPLKKAKKEKEPKKEKEAKKEEKKDEDKKEKKKKDKQKKKDDEKKVEKKEEKKKDENKDDKKKKKKKDSSSTDQDKKKKKKKSSDDSNMAEVPSSSSALETSEEVSHHLTAIASPLATKEETVRKLHQLIGLAAQEKNSFVRGLKHVAKQLRKGAKGLCILAGNVSPVDVISHFPSFCQEKEVPYVFLRTKEQIGAAAGVKRSITVALITNELKSDKGKELMAFIVKERNKAQPMKGDALKKEF